MIRFTLPKWTDFHMHARQGQSMSSYLAAHKAMGCCGILPMPNTKPPVSRVFGPNTTASWSIEGYRELLLLNGADTFEHLITPLYLTAGTTPEMIAQGAKSGWLKSAKYYPPHGTTNSGAAAPFQHYIDNGVFKAMQKHGVILNIHGESHGLSDDEWFGPYGNAEKHFYQNEMPKLLRRYPRLKIVCEHITTATAVAFVKSCGPNVAATICPQHLLYTTATLIRNMAVHLLCMPVVKFPDDRDDLLAAATVNNRGKFFAGTDSAPHFKGAKETPCGCAAGCFTGGYAPQLYAMAFEAAGVRLSNKRGQAAFRRFLVDNGNKFYGLPTSTETFTLEKAEGPVEVLHTPEADVIPLPLGLKQSTLPWRIAA